MQMQSFGISHSDQERQRVLLEPLLPRKLGTIPVTVRLDPPRYDRLKRLVQRFSTTGQHIIQTALDRSMISLERQKAVRPDSDGQSSLFEASTISANARRAAQDSFVFARPKPTIALTYRASVPMHRWLHRRSTETGQTIQDIINEALMASQRQ